MRVLTGVLYGVGVGPGDPELLTLKAVRLIEAAAVVAYPALVGGESLARSIAARFVSRDAVEIVVEVPMTVERGPAQVAYDQGAAAITEALRGGDDVVYLCEGDPFVYGSFMYLFARLSGEFRVEVVPGVSSVNAGAARAGVPLVAREERLTVLTGSLPRDELRRQIEAADSVAVMKVGRHLGKVRAVIDGLGLGGKATYIERVSMVGEVVCPLAEAPQNAPYFSMILVVKGSDPWL